MIRFTLIYLAILTSAFSAVAENTLIQGNAFYYRGKDMEIHQYQDLFTFKSIPLDSQQIGEDGNFKFNIDISQTDLILVKIGKIHAHLFAVPGEQYTLVIPEPLEMDRFNPAKDVFIQPEIFEANSKLNYYITKLEKDLNGFFIDNTSNSFNLRSAGNIRMFADSFALIIDSTYAEIDDAYFKSYMHFRMAEFELTTRHSKSKVYNDYFKDHRPAYNQLSFAHAFELFYNGFIEPHSVFSFSDSLESSIKKGDAKRMHLYLSTHEYLQKPEYLELLMVTGLFELGRKRTYKLPVIIDLLDTIKHNTPSNEILNISNSAQSILLRLAPGTKAPNFVFADVVGNLYRISEYEGYYIYIQFFEDFNSESLRQMSLMKVLREGYGADIAMFSFSTSESLKRLREIPGKHDFDWFFGKIGSPDKVIDDYDLRAFPTYFFLDEELKIVNSPTPPPGARIEKSFAKIWNEKHPNKMMPFKLQPPGIKESEMIQVPKK